MEFFDKIRAPRIQSLRAPTEPQDVVRLADTATSDTAGLMAPGDLAKINTMAWAPVTVATTAPLAATVSGTELHGDTNVALGAIDSYMVVVGDRILVMNQETQAQNGIYVVKDLGSDATPWVLERAADAANSADFLIGKVVRTIQGGTLQYKVFRCMVELVDLGTTPIEFGEYILAQEGVDKAKEIPVTGDGVWLTKEVVHSLGTKKVQTAIYDENGMLVRFGVIRDDENTITIVAETPPADGKTFYVVVTAS